MLKNKRKAAQRCFEKDFFHRSNTKLKVLHVKLPCSASEANCNMIAIASGGIRSF